MSAFTSRDVENVLRSVFKRCLRCPPQAPSCSPCQEGYICVQTPPSCGACALTSCEPADTDPTSSSSTHKSGPNAGAIAGGVVGGVVFIVLLTFAIWKYYLKGKRRPYEEGEWQEVDMTAQEKSQNDFASRRSTRMSTHTVASMASSVLTRASNIIQIAYIPGVTNRSGPGSPDLLVPPVPPIPALSPSISSSLNSPYPTSEQHFFVPDFRDSMASTSTDVRSSYARTSIAPSLARASVASTVYRQNAIVSPLPAQTIVRGKAAVVSVKSSGSSSPTDTLNTLNTLNIETPPVPQIDPKHSSQPVRVQMPRMLSASSSSAASSIRSTATLGPVRALNITKKKPASDSTPPVTSGSDTNASSDDTVVPPARPLTEVSVASTDDGIAHARARRASGLDSDSDSDDDDHSRARQSLLRQSDNTDIQDTPASLQSPFSDTSSIDAPDVRPDAPRRHTSRSSRLQAPMTPITEEGDKRASRASKRTQSPFSDDNKSEI